MPWYHRDYPPPYKNQPKKMRDKVTEITNEALKTTGNEGEAIATGLKQARLHFKKETGQAKNAKDQHLMDKPSYLHFKADQYAWKPDIDYRLHQELYRVGKGEQGVLICEPYKSEIGRNWRFKTEAIAIESSEAIYSQFLEFVNQDDFVGMDMARKYLQMGYTRARRYANYKGGKKYDKEHNYEQLQRGTGEDEKAKAAAIFYKKWKAADASEPYRTLKALWKKEKG